MTPVPEGPDLQISLLGNPNPPWTVTPTGTVIFVGSGGTATVNGQPGTDAFTLTNAAVTFAAADVFNGATIQFSGNIGREIDAKGTANSFDVSGLPGAATLIGPDLGGHGQHRGGEQDRRRNTDQYVTVVHRRHEIDLEGLPPPT